MLEEKLKIAREALSASRIWLPNIFAACFDLLAAPGSCALDSPVLKDRSARNDHLRRHVPALKESQRKRIGTVTEEFRRELAAALDQMREPKSRPEGTREVMYALWVMEAVLQRLMKHDASDETSYLADYRARMTGGNTLLRQGERVDGYLMHRLRKHAGPIRTLDDCFDHLVRIPALANLELSYRLWGSPIKADKGVLRVGVIPVVQARDELEWSEPSRETYQVKVANEEQQKKLTERVLSALAWMADQQVDLVLMPELVGSQSMLDCIKAWRGGPEQGEKPQLILTGSFLHPEPGGSSPEGRTDQRNCACVIDERGVRVAVQNKLHRRTFSATDPGPHGVFSEACDRHEGIAITPRQLAVMDVAEHERLCVLIGEDFNQQDPHCEVIRKLGVSRILVPGMRALRRLGSSSSVTLDIPQATLVRYPTASQYVMANSGALLGHDDVPHWSDFARIFVEKDGQCSETDPEPQIDALPGSTVPRAIILRSTSRS